MKPQVVGALTALVLLLYGAPEARCGRPVAGSRDATVWPFAVSSIWNLPVANSARFQNATAFQTLNLTDGHFTTGINSEAYSLPVYYASASDPWASVVWIDAHDLSYRDRGTFRYRIPDRAKPSGPSDGGDLNLVVIDPDRRHAHETWLMEGSNPIWRTGYYIETDLYGPGFGEGGPRAYGGSSLGGLVRKFDVQKGMIRHALALALDTTQLAAYEDGAGRCVGYVWPAIGQDMTACTPGARYQGLNPVGSYAAIPGTVDLRSLGLKSRAGEMIAQAAQDYGVYVVDRAGGGANALYAEPGVGEQWLAALRTSGDLDRVRRDLRVVTDNGPSTPNGGPYDAGGGNRRASLAPPLN